MSEIWTAVKRSCHCNNKRDVQEPKPRDRTRNIVSSSSLRECRPNEVSNGSKRSPNCSPLSMRSNDLLSPLNRIVRCASSDPNLAKDHDLVHGGLSPFWSLGSRAAQNSSGGAHSLSRTGGGSSSTLIPGSSSLQQQVLVRGSSFGGNYRQTFCQKYSELLSTRDGVEQHHLHQHAVREVEEGDPSRKIIEIIFKAGWRSSDNCAHIETILKVYNPETKVAEFEQYREMVKIRAQRPEQDSKRYPHPRCLADGNELLRFYGTTLVCPLGQYGCSSLCSMQGCNLCCILRHGFSSSRSLDQSVLGILTTSTGENQGLNVRRRLGFGSLAGKMESNGSSVEDLYLLNPTALLPFFVVICK